MPPLRRSEEVRISLPFQKRSGFEEMSYAQSFMEVHEGLVHECGTLLCSNLASQAVLSSMPACVLHGKLSRTDSLAISGHLFRASLGAMRIARRSKNALFQLKALCLPVATHARELGGFPFCGRATRNAAVVER